MWGETDRNTLRCSFLLDSGLGGDRREPVNDMQERSFTGSERDPQMSVPENSIIFIFDQSVDYLLTDRSSKF